MDEPRGVTAFRLEGTSMSPVFRAGGIALVSGAASFGAQGALAPGDCAVYEYRGRTMLHRVVKTEASGAWFADDAGAIKRHKVPWTAVRGKVVRGGFLSGGLPGLLYHRCGTAFRKLISKFR